MTNKRRYSPEFRLEAAQFVVDQGYTLKGGLRCHEHCKSTMEYSVRRLRSERAGSRPKGEALTSEQHEIQELKRRLRRTNEAAQSGLDRRYYCYLERSTLAYLAFRHSGGLPPNVAELTYWNAQKMVA
ncbi:transposase-like protein [Marinobacter sp. LV10R520-4]|uniref:transposase n=1 Tax=Marinobacter sp. LV10R520-4 TaxID=1761796 RepID=UPI000C00950D|nr:transposase-like protein [Marinobacter sp. LV10R520-4]